MRKRLPLLPRGSACALCKRRKRKCNAGRPACDTCIGLGRESTCSYDTTARSTMKQLRDRIWELEHRLVEAQTEDRQKQLEPQQSDAPVIDTVDRGISLFNKTTEWWKTDEIPPIMSDYLTTIFLKHATQLHFDHVSSFLARIYRYPPSHPNYPQPSLLNAMYLHATFYLASNAHPSDIQRRLGRSPGEVEANLFKKTRQALAYNLARARNIFDYLLASALVAKYLHSTMRHAEGHNEAAGAMRLAVACNLHIITTPHDLYSIPPSLLPPPEDEAEVWDRISAFWSIFMSERAGSMMSGLPISLPDEKITTVFLLPENELEAARKKGFSTRNPDDSQGDQPKYNYTDIRSLYDPTSLASDVTFDTSHCVKAKGCATMPEVRALVSRAKRQGLKRFQDASLEFMLDFMNVERAVLTIIATIPPVPRLAMTSEQFQFRYDQELANLANAQTVMRAVLIQLHGSFWQNDPESHSKVIRATQEIVAIAQGMQKTNEVCWQIPIPMGWGNACEVYHKEISRIADIKEHIEGREGILLKLLNNMECLANMFRRFMSVYRGHDSGLNVIEEMLAHDTELIKSRFPNLQDDLGAQIEEIDDNLSRRLHHEDARPLQWVQWLSLNPAVNLGSLG